LGVRLPRWAAAAVDGVLMIVGTIYVVWIATDFIGPFQGFLITLGVPIAAWCGIFLGDLARRRQSYAEPDLYDPRGRYGSVNLLAVGTLLVATVIGWGLVVNTFSPAFAWQGYLLEPTGLGPKLDGPWTFANLGVLAALALGFLLQFTLGGSAVRRQEAAPDVRSTQ
jgi:nucleobase:cation symporter-1, NCS1 family